MKQENKSRVLILGHGEMGQAMEFLLSPFQTLRIWQRHPPAGESPVHLQTAVPESDFVLFCLPAIAHAAVATQIAPHLRGDTLCLTIAKGLDDHGRLPTETLAEAVGVQRVAVLYGPMISEEIRAGKPAFAECGATDPATSERIATLFRGTALRLEPSQDIAGLSWSAILKNVYAMVFGIADELNLGDNTRGYLAVAALHELAAIVKNLGGDRSTPYRLAGLGDLITTATSTGSHHHELGRLIARGIQTPLSGEGVHTLDVLRGAGRFVTSNYPLFQLIDASLQKPNLAREQFLNYLHRQAI